jgi:hypothetical protein
MNRIAALSLPLLLASCGGPQTGLPPEPLRKLDEARAFEIMLGAFGEMNMQAERDRKLTTAASGEFEVDLAVPGKPVAIEYLDANDRNALSAALPARHGDALRIMAANDAGGAEVQVFIIDEADYEFDPNPEQSGGGRAPTVQEVEGRLRRDVIDFLQYARNEGLSQ